MKELRIVVLNEKTGIVSKVEVELGLELVKSPKYTAILSGKRVSRKEAVNTTKLVREANTLYNW